MKKTCPKTHSPKKCPACGLNDAIIDSTLGVVHCLSCQAKDVRITKSPEFYSLAKKDRVQRIRDEHSADLVQPFSGTKPNPDFFKLYPDKIKEYNVGKDLEKL